MARNTKKSKVEEVEEILDRAEVQQEQEQESEKELLPEQKAIKDAFESDDVVVALTNIQNTEGTSEILSTMIITYIALMNALGADAPATEHAKANLLAYEPAKVKAKKEKKEPAFNEVKELKKVLETEVPDFSGLMSDERVSEALKIEITTFTTLADLEVPQAVKDSAMDRLKSFGSKNKKVRGGGTAQQACYVQAGDTGLIYTNLAGALRAHGYGDDLIETETGKKHRAIDIAWRATRKAILENGTVEYDGVTYTKVEPTEDAISTARKSKVDEEVEEVEEVVE